ncbi:DUF6877 family protein [Bacillus mycoides]|uniref:DUF6877 family protein n=1 Tax=Bacillus mycoides TaxID=1405 RepID=UPI003D65B6A2
MSSLLFWKVEVDSMNPLDEITKIASQLPLKVLEDITRRISDWIVSGGKNDDPYIEMQLRYAKRFIKE